MTRLSLQSIATLYHPDTNGYGLDKPMTIMIYNTSSSPDFSYPVTPPSDTKHSTTGPSGHFARSHQLIANGSNPFFSYRADPCE